MLRSGVVLAERPGANELLAERVRGARFMGVRSVGDRLGWASGPGGGPKLAGVLLGENVLLAAVDGLNDRTGGIEGD